MDIFRFRKFPVYLLAREFRSQVRLSAKKEFPKEENFRLFDQLIRALNSVVLNIAEGSDHFSGVEFGKYLNIALTSLNEVMACLDCAYDDGYIDNKTLNNFISDAEVIARQLKAFSSKLRADKK